MNQQLMINALVRRQIFLGRYANGTNRRAQTELTSVLKAIQERILTGGLNPFQEEWLIRQFDSVAEIAFGEAEALAPKEAEFDAKVLTAGGVANVEALAASDVIASFNNEPAELISGKTITKLTPAEMTEVYSKGESNLVLQTFRDGRLSGLTNAQISKNIDDIVKPRSRQHTETLVRTLTNQSASVARRDTYELNDIELEEYVSVLDGRTTVTCASLSGNIYKVGKGPSIPRHYNCRSLYVPYFDGDPVGQDYNKWLKKQPKSLQVEVLGEERANLYRSGEVKLEQFTNNQGIEYTLDELEDLYDISIEEA
jgi:SPP1 gp7 family putative phage head morphogenesis protein